MRVLVVDDQRYWRHILEETLAGQGHDVRCVESGEQALRVLARDPAVGLLVTDWVMPEMSGLELCRRARELERDRYLPIILLTSRNGPEDLVEALGSGADSFVRKPFEAPELLAQVRVTERIIALEARLEARIGELREAQARIESDLAQAAEVQRSFLPTAPPVIPGFEFAWHCAPCEQLGGDLFNVERLSERHVGVHVLDVSGHGTSPALFSATLSHLLSPVAQQGGILKQVSPNGQWSVACPSRVTAELNHRFPLIERSGHFVTILYGVLDLDTLRFRYASAGHPGPLWLHRGEPHACEEGGGIPIGVMENAEYADCEIQLERGDALLFVTDGVLETRSPQGEAYGVRSVLDVLRVAGPRGAADTIESLRRSLDAFRKHEPQRDDLTAVAFSVEREPAPGR